MNGYTSGKLRNSNTNPYLSHMRRVQADPPSQPATVYSTVPYAAELVESIDLGWRLIFFVSDEDQAAHARRVFAKLAAL